MIRLITAMFLYLLLAVWAFAQTPAPVKLAWTHSTDNVAVTGYNIYRDGKKIGSSPTTSYTDATVAPTTQYSYTVSAFDAAGNESDTSLPTSSRPAPSSFCRPTAILRSRRCICISSIRCLEMTPTLVLSPLLGKAPTTALYVGMCCW